MELKTEPKSSPRAFQDALGARLPAEAVFGCIFSVLGGPRNPKNHAPATVRAQFRLKSLTAPGAPKSSPTASQNRAQNPPWRLQDGFKTRLKKGFDFSTEFQPFFDDFGGPRGAGGGSKWPPESLQKRPSLQSSVFPAPEALQDSILTPSGLDFGPSGR